MITKSVPWNDVGLSLILKVCLLATPLLNLWYWRSPSTSDDDPSKVSKARRYDIVIMVCAVNEDYESSSLALSLSRVPKPKLTAPAPQWIPLVTSSAYDSLSLPWIGGAVMGDDGRVDVLISEEPQQNLLIPT